MKNIVKLILLLLFISLLVFVYFYFQQEESKERMDDFNLDEELDYDDYLDQLEKPLDTRLTYEKEMFFVYIQEMNTAALKEIPLDDLTTDELSFNEETEAMYFYNEDQIPWENTELIVLYEVYNLDFLLDQKIYFSNDVQERIRFSDISFTKLPEEEQPVNNENRLFLNESVVIDQIGETENLLVEFKDSEFELGRGEYKDFILEDDERISRILIRNFGKWDTLNMKYEITE